MFTTLQQSQTTYLRQDILASELSHDEAVFIRTLLVLSMDDEAVFFCLDVDLLRLELLHAYVCAKFLVVVDYLSKDNNLAFSCKAG